jgi:hypothetical protein
MAPICDFCSSEAVHWRYPARDFAAPGLLAFFSKSAGDWAACDACHDLIEKDERAALVERVFISAPPDLVTPYAIRFVQDLHASFYTCRTGPAEPISARVQVTS